MGLTDGDLGLSNLGKSKNKSILIMDVLLSVSVRDLLTQQDQFHPFWLTLYTGN